MAIDAKMSFINSVEKALAAVVTASNMSKILSAISDVAQGFDMSEIAVSDTRNDDMLDCFLDALRIEGKSPKTLEHYKYVLTRMMNDIAVSTRQITVHHLRNYLAKEKGRGIADKTLEGVRNCMASYFNWLQRESLIEKNPIVNLGTIKCAKKKKLIFTDVELDNLKSSCKTKRDKAIICFLITTGCRISEVTSLDRENIDFNRKECIVHGKGNKERRVYFDDITAMALKKYLEERTDDNPALFIGKRMERLLPGGVRDMLNVLAKAAGVEHCHPHKFRRTLATNLAKRGMPIQKIAAILGHEKIDTSMQYIVQNDEDIKISYKMYA